MREGLVDARRSAFSVRPRTPRGNAWARLASLILRWGAPKSSLPRLAVIGLLFLTWLGLGVIGWREGWQKGGAGPKALLDLIYATLGLLAPRADLRSGVMPETLMPTPIPLFLDLAKWAGVLLSFSSLIFVFSKRISRTLSAMIVRNFARGHVVVFAPGRGQTTPAAAAARDGAAVTAVLDHGDAETVDALANLGVAVVVEPFETALAKAGLERAARIVVAYGDDIRNLTLAERLSAAFPKLEGDLHVQSEDRAVLESLRRISQRFEAPIVRPFSLADSAARNALQALRLWDGPEPLRLAVVSDGPFAEAFVRQTLALGWRSGHPAPTAIFWDQDGRIEDRWRIFAPAAIGGSAGDIFGPAHAGFGVAFSQAATLTDFLRQTRGFSAWLVDDDVSCAASAATFLRQIASGEPVGPVITSGPEALNEAVQGVVMAPMGFEHGLCDALFPELDHRAAELHLAYLGRAESGAMTAGSEDAIVDWGRIPQTYIVANRAAADHMPVKAADAAGRDPNADPALLESLAEVEHLRWSAERILNGWTSGPRSAELRRHPDLIPWSALSEDSRQKDREAVLNAFAILGQTQV